MDVVVVVVIRLSLFKSEIQLAVVTVLQLAGDDAIDVTVKVWASLEEVHVDVLWEAVGQSHRGRFRTRSRPRVCGYADVERMGPTASGCVTHGSGLGYVCHVILVGRGRTGRE